MEPLRVPVAMTLGRAGFSREPEAVKKATRTRPDRRRPRPTDHPRRWPVSRRSACRQSARMIPASSRPRRPVAPSLGASALVCAGCGRPPTHDAPAERQPAELARRSARPVRDARPGRRSTPRSSGRSRRSAGSSAKTPVEPSSSIDDATLGEDHRPTLRRGQPAGELVGRRAERLYQALGLLPAGRVARGPLRRAARAARSPASTRRTTKQLYVVSRPAASGRPRRSRTPTSTTTRSRTRTSTSTSSGARRDRPGRPALARLPLVEGDATLLMTYWAQQQPDPGRARPGSPGANDPEQTAVLDGMPAILRETAPVPVPAGPRVRRWRPDRRRLAGASTPLFAKPPDSTEQILHPDKYAAGEAPVAVDLPEGPRHAARRRLEGRRWRTRSASSSSASGSSGRRRRPGDRRRGRRGLGRRPGRAASTDRTAPGRVVIDTALGHPADATEFARPPRRPRRHAQAAARADRRSDAADRVTLFLGDRRRHDRRTLASVLGLAG